MSFDFSKAEFPKTGQSSTVDKIMKPGRNYIATRFCIPSNFYLSFLLGQSSNLSIATWQISNPFVFICANIVFKNRCVQ